MKKRKKALGIFLLIFGVAAILASYVIEYRLKEGKIKIGRAQSYVEGAEGLLSLHPDAYEVGRRFTDAAQREIDQGYEEINQYEILILVLQIGGLAIILVGLLEFFFQRRKKQ